MHTATITHPLVSDERSVRHRAQRSVNDRPRTARRELRGAIGLFLAVVAFLCGVSLVPNLADRAATFPASRAVRVEASDTLWRIAIEHPIAGVTTAEVVAAIRSANGLAAGTVLQPGSVLRVPASVPTRNEMLAMR